MTMTARNFPLASSHSAQGGAALVVAAVKSWRSAVALPFGKHKIMDWNSSAPLLPDFVPILLQARDFRPQSVAEVLDSVSRVRLLSRKKHHIHSMMPKMFCSTRKREERCAFYSRWPVK